MTEVKKGFTIRDKRHFDGDGNVREDADADDVKGDEKPAENLKAGEAVKGAEEGEDAKKEGPRSDKGGLPSIDFSTFLISFASSAQMHMGLVPNPMTKRPDRDLPSAKQTIDILGMLEEKTRGNLGKKEEDLIKELLYALRMQYVEVSRLVDKDKKIKS